MKVTFHGPAATYRVGDYAFTKGQTRDVPDDVANGLLESGNFAAEGEDAPTSATRYNLLANVGKFPNKDDAIAYAEGFYGVTLDRNRSLVELNEATNEIRRRAELGLNMGTIPGVTNAPEGGRVIPVPQAISNPAPADGVLVSVDRVAPAVEAANTVKDPTAEGTTTVKAGTKVTLNADQKVTEDTKGQLITDTTDVEGQSGPTSPVGAGNTLVTP